MLSWKNTGLHDVSSVFLTIYKETDGVGLCLLFKCDRAEQILEQKLYVVSWLSITSKSGPPEKKRQDCLHELYKYADFSRFSGT